MYFHALVSFVRDGFCLFPFLLGVGNRLRLLIVALPGLFFLPGYRYTAKSRLEDLRIQAPCLQTVYA